MALVKLETKLALGSPLVWCLELYYNVKRLIDHHKFACIFLNSF